MILYILVGILFVILIGSIVVVVVGIFSQNEQPDEKQPDEIVRFTKANSTAEDHEWHGKTVCAETSQPSDGALKESPPRRKRDYPSKDKPTVKNKPAKAKSRRHLKFNKPRGRV